MVKVRCRVPSTTCIWPRCADLQAAFAGRRGLQGSLVARSLQLREQLHGSCNCHLSCKNFVGYITIAMFALGMSVPGYCYNSRLNQIKVHESRIRKQVAIVVLARTKTRIEEGTSSHTVI